MTLFSLKPSSRKREPVVSRQGINVFVVQSLDELFAALSVRSRVFQSEQNCPYAEEFDGNDLAGATHLIAVCDGEPVGTMRIRWFGSFAKLERFAVLPKNRSMHAALAMKDAAYAVAARKGFSVVLGHVQLDVVSFWTRRGGGRVRDDRPSFRFSGYDFVEVIRELELPADALSLDSPPLILDRPEGDWDREGILDLSSKAAA
jgi:predicted GNAT family N-acyltransferase